MLHYEFRGGEGFQEDVLGLLSNYRQIPYACDASWISKFPTEQEVLISKHSIFNPYPSKSRQIGKKQWIVCNVGSHDKPFEKLFLANNQQLR